MHHVSKLGIEQEPLPERRSCEELIPLSACKHSKVDKDSESYKFVESDLLVFKNYASNKQVLGNEQNSLLHWCLAPKETARLVSRCREEQTTVHGAICAAFLLSIADESSSTNSAFLRCMSQLSLRNHLLPPVGEDFGVYYTRELTYHQIELKIGFWEVAREVKHQLNWVTANDQIFASVLKVKAFLSTQPNPNRLRQFVTELIGSDLTVTNLGRLNIPEQYGSLQLQQLHLTVAGIAPITVGVATLGGKLFVSCHYLKSIIPQVYAENISKAAMQQLQSAIN